MITNIEITDNLGRKYQSIHSAQELQHIMVMLRDRGLTAVSMIAMAGDGFEVMRKDSERVEQRPDWNC